MSSKLTSEYRFIDLKNFTALQQIDDERWRQFNLFFKTQKNATSNKNMIRISELKRSFYSHQTYVVFWMLINENDDVKNEFLNDEMRLEKVRFSSRQKSNFKKINFYQNTIMLTLIVVSKWLMKAQWKVNEIKKFEKFDLDFFFDFKLNEKSSVLICSNDSYFFCCFCVESDSLNSFDSVLKFILIIVFLHFISNWIKKWNKIIDKKYQWIKFKLKIEHKNSDSTFQNFDIKEYIINDNEKKNIVREKNVMFTSNMFYMNQVYSKLKTVNKKHSIYKNSIRWKKIIKNKSHLKKAFISVAVKLFIDLFRAYQNKLWFLNETSFDKSSVNMTEYFKILKIKNWKAHFKLKIDTKKMTVIDKRFDKLIRDDNWNAKNKKNLVDKFDEFLTTMMIRRTSDTQWFD